MNKFKTYAYINSLNIGKMDSTEMDEITIIEKINSEQPKYIVDYKGTKCYAIFNPFNFTYYVDDVYGVIK